MKKVFAMVLVVVMILALGATAFAAGGKLSLEQAKQAALNHAGVKAADATFTKAHSDWEYGREVYEFEFYAGSTEYDVDVDANSGEIVKFSTEFHGGYTTPNYGYSYGYYYDDDMYDRDWDDMYDRDWDDMYDRDFDDLFDWDD